MSSCPRFLGPLPAALGASLLLLAEPSPVLGQQAEGHTLTGDAVAVHSLVGEVRVVPATGPNAEAAVVRRGPDAAELRVDIVRHDGWEALQVSYPDNRIVYPPLGRTRIEWDWSLFGGDDDVFRDLAPSLFGRITISGDGPGVEAHADITVHLPPGKRLSVHLAAGNVELENVEGDLRVRARAATVNSRDTRGPLHIEARSGSVRVAGATGDVDVTTRSGSIEASTLRGNELQLRSRSGSIQAAGLEFGRASIHSRSGSHRLDDARGERLEVSARSGNIRGAGVSAGDLDASTRSGDVELNQLSAAALRVNTRSGTVDLGLVTAFDSGRIETRSGEVTVRVPTAVAAELDLQSRSGIQVDVPAIFATDQGRDHFRGRLGEGGAPLEIRTRSGRIRVVES